MKIFDDIAAIFRGKDHAAAEISALLDQTENEIRVALASARNLKADALDPALDAMAANTKHSEAVLADFRVQRLEAAKVRLAEVLIAAQHGEDQAGKAARYQAAKVQRDAVAKEIAERYPAIEKGLVKLIRQIIDASASVNQANADLPEGAALLDKPEGFARGFPDARAESVDGLPAIRIVEMVVPTLTDCTKAAWPPNYNRYPSAPRIGAAQLESMFNDGFNDDQRK